jgi:hypothetical protein
MRLKCRLGIHRWTSFIRIEPDDGHMFVFTYMYCQDQECRYWRPTIYDVERRPKPLKGFDVPRLGD